MAERTEVKQINLKNKADYIRKKMVDWAVKCGAEHIAPALSTIDLLTVLYYDIMSVSKNGNWENRDRFILSKGHGCYGLYTILNDLAIIPDDEWRNFHNGSSLKGCVVRNTDYGLEAGCGSLGHGLPVAAGVAFGAKIQNKDYQIYCMVGDGEMQEGSMWEALQFAAKHELSNLTVIVDNNSLQAMDFLENILTPIGRKDDLEKKFEAFGFETITCDGHNIDNISAILNNWKDNGDNKKPKALIAKTIKGYGLHCMENIPKFHFRMPTQEELNMGNRYE